MEKIIEIEKLINTQEERKDQIEAKDAKKQRITEYFQQVFQFFSTGILESIQKSEYQTSENESYSVNELEQIKQSAQIMAKTFTESLFEDDGLVQFNQLLETF